MDVAEEKSKVYISTKKLILYGLKTPISIQSKPIPMATLAVSPRRALTVQEKEQRDIQYKVDLKTFGTILKNLTQLFNALVALNTALGQAGKGAYLAFPNPAYPGTMVPFNRKHLRSANAKFAKA